MSLSMLKVRYLGAKEMAQWLRILTALPLDPGFPAPTRQLKTVILRSDNLIKAYKQVKTYQCA